MSAIEIKVPDIGDFKEVEVIELLVKPGDKVQLEQSLITVESERLALRFPAMLLVWSNPCSLKSVTRYPRAHRFLCLSLWKVWQV